MNKSYLLAPKTTTRNTRREYPDIVTLAMISPNSDPTYHNGVTKQRGKKGKESCGKIGEGKKFSKKKRGTKGGKREGVDIDGDIRNEKRSPFPYDGPSMTVAPGNQ